jgi:carboxypeptidase Q
METNKNHAVRRLFGLLAILLLFLHLAAQENVDLQIMQRIRQEGLENSRVMEYLSYLCDVYGPRLSESPQYRQAAEWAVNKLKELGLENAALEPWGTFGRSWELHKYYAAMTEPRYMPLIGYPQAWTPGTNGLLKGNPVLLDVKKAEDLNKFKGQIKGAIVMVGGEQELEMKFDPSATRETEEDLKKMEMAPEPGARSPYADRMEEFIARRRLQEAVSKFLNDEGAAVVLEPSHGKNGTVFVQSGGSRLENAPPVLPTVVVSVEQYNRMVRILQKKIPLAVEIEIQANFVGGDLIGSNIVAEIPGIDKKLKDEVVMLGAHFDSWHSGTGATDNGAGCVVAMEAVRILQAIGLKPRRTVRIALWDAEEQGLIGSGEYVKKHFADRIKREKKADYDKLSAYFNLDNGSGKIRGIYAQGDIAAMPIFEEWLRPFHDLGAATVSVRNTGGTDHLSFDRVGLPGFQFIQDELEYDTLTHHSNMDVVDHASKGDLMQAATIMAAFVYNAAMRQEKMPRKYFDLKNLKVPTAPFHY